MVLLGDVVIGVFTVVHAGDVLFGQEVTMVLDLQELCFRVEVFYF